MLDAGYSNVDLLLSIKIVYLFILDFTFHHCDLLSLTKADIDVGLV